MKVGSDTTHQRDDREPPTTVAIDNDWCPSLNSIVDHLSLQPQLVLSIDVSLSHALLTTSSVSDIWNLIFFICYLESTTYYVRYFSQSEPLPGIATVV